MDARITNHGSIILIHPRTKTAQDWIRENCQVEPWQYLGPNLAVEPRYCQAIVEGMQEAGLEVETL